MAAVGYSYHNILSRVTRAACGCNGCSDAGRRVTKRHMYSSQTFRSSSCCLQAAIVAAGCFTRGHNASDYISSLSCMQCRLVETIQRRLLLATQQEHDSRGSRAYTAPVCTIHVFKLIAKWLQRDAVPALAVLAVAEG